jgi:2-oxoisovalerate dehydrogenase E1 component alpha subunit
VHGETELIRLLSPEGERVEHGEYRLDPSADELRALYRDMALVRRFDREAFALQRQGELALWPPSLGQEAAQIGAGRALADSDYVFPVFREHGVAWCRGINPVDLLKMYRGVTHGGWQPEKYGFHLYSVVLGPSLLHATGYAMGMGLEGAQGAVLAFFGDGASSQGDVHEAFVFAASYQAPVVFVCQNNQWAISTPVSRQSRTPLSWRARGYGFPGVRVDGNDVLAMLAVTAQALERARDGGGPTLIEAVTYRMGPHATSDDPTRYRPSAELEVWESRDPLVRLRRHLVAAGAADGAFFDRTDAEGEQLAEQVRRELAGLPSPDPLSMFDHVYAEPHASVTTDRARFAAYLDSFIDADAKD